jgi:hypothetical protein
MFCIHSSVAMILTHHAGVRLFCLSKRCAFFFHHASKHYHRMLTIDDYRTHTNESDSVGKQTIADHTSNKKHYGLREPAFLIQLCLFRTNKHHPRARMIDEYQKHTNDTRPHMKAIDHGPYKQKKVLGRRAREVGPISLDLLPDFFFFLTFFSPSSSRAR